MCPKVLICELQWVIVSYSELQLLYMHEGAAA
jgi:hypothetical protein